MNAIVRQFRDFFVSLKLTVVLLVAGMLLVFFATLDQVNLGVWGIQQKWFHSLFVLQYVGDVPLPIYPGGYLIGGLLLINLIASHIYRLKFTWRKTGLQLAHSGLILLLLGELLSGLLQRDFQMRLVEGETKNFSDSDRYNELAIIETTDPKFDDVVAIPEQVLARDAAIQHPKLPFRVLVKAYYPNSSLHLRDATTAANPSPANQGIGPRVVVVPLALTYKQDQRNVPSAFLEFVGPEGSLGTWLATSFVSDAQTLTYAGRTWRFGLRPERVYKPFSLTLLKVTHDVYLGTDIPKNFSSRVRITTPDGRDDREVLIYMNNPLRYAGLTFYQYQMDSEHATSVLQVVRNPSWLLPYLSCALITLGLLIQFCIHLGGFVVKRPAAARTEPHESRTPQHFLPFLALLLGLAFVAKTLIPPGNAPDVAERPQLRRADKPAQLAPPAPADAVPFDLAGFGSLPVVANGRVKPFDTIARSTLLQLQGRQRVSTPEISAPLVQNPTEWLVDVLFRPEKADGYPTFRIDSPDLLSLMGISEDAAKIAYASTAKRVLAVLGFIPSTRSRFSYLQLQPHLAELDRQAKLAQPVEPQLRTPFQKAALQLQENIVLYQRLKYSLVAPDSADFLGELARFQESLATGIAAVRAKQAGQPHDEAAASAMIALGQRFIQMSEAGYLIAVPPASGENHASDWKNAGTTLLETFESGRLSPYVMTYAGLARTWRTGQPEQFNHIVELYRAQLAKAFSVTLRKGERELRFNAAEPFYTSMELYVIAFLVAVFSWLRWPAVLSRSAFWLVVVGWLLTTAGIATRMWLEGRPPVTNLYSSALFIGWAAVALCLVLESVYKNAVGSVAAGLVGFGTLLIAHHLSLSGDTLEMMRAVLDSNFWLATHVVTVTIGYSATFLAGFLAIIYIVMGLFTPWLNRTPTDRSAALGGAAALSPGLAATAAAVGRKSETNGDMLNRMVYGIVCFATLFSFVGTVLGGIWADQSWGRFWGWDPKENGALIIVVWDAIILHARWGGLIRQRGLMALAVFGNIVTAWSWFGTNMLGIGLHSYGFTEAAFVALIAFVASQLVLIAVANLPREKWRSFRAAV